MINIYPGLNNGYLTLEITKETEDEILVDVFNQSGEKIYSQRVTGNLHLVDISSHPRGLYMLKVTIGKSVQYEKVYLD